MKTETLFITIVTVILVGIMSTILVIAMTAPDVPENVRILVAGFASMCMVLVFGLAAILSWIVGVHVKMPFSNFANKDEGHTPELTEAEWSRYAEISDWVESEEMTQAKPKFEIDGSFAKARGISR